MLIRWYMLFSNWIFVASLANLVGVEVPTFQANLIALPFGLAYVVGKVGIDPWWKVLYVGMLHFAPFAWVTWSITMGGWLLTGTGMLAYAAFMWSRGWSIVETYRTMFTETHTSLQEYLADRFGR
jgi:hypothetical protein